MTLPANGGLEQAFRAARLDIFAGQAFAGTKVALGAIAMATFLMTPAIGIGWALSWAMATAAAFQLRDIYARRVLAHGAITRATEDRLGAASLAVGLVIHSPSPWVTPLMTDDQRSIYIAMVVVWIAMAAMELGLLPRSYRIYIPMSLGMLSVGILRALPWSLALIACLLLVAAGVFLLMFSQLLIRQIEDVVRARRRNDDLVVKLTESLRATEEAQQAKSRFLAAASHDLLQPVHAMSLLVDVAQRSPETAIGRRALARMATTSALIDSMFRSLLDQARLDAGAFTPHIESVNLATVLSAIAAAYEDECASRGVRLHCEVEPELHALADATLLDRCVRNVIDNAVKFTREGEIRLTATRVGDHIEIIVVDSGCGIASAEQDKVFDVFYRGTSPEPHRTAGTGLGLSNARQFLALLRGDIGLSSQPGAGTTVRITLPMSPQAWLTPTVDQAPSQLDEALPSRAVLVVEDDALAREAITIWLERQGMTVMAATSLADALVRCTQGAFTPEVIVSDLHLAQGPDGMATIAGLRARFGNCPAALVTGEAPDHIPDTTGVVVMHKPIDPDEMLQFLRQLGPASTSSARVV